MSLPSRFVLASVFLAAIVAASVRPSPAQDGPPASPVLPEHELLTKFVGSWVCDAEAVMGPDGEKEKSVGKINSHMLGGLWVVNELQFDSPAGTMRGLQTIGYDPKKGKYVGTWVDSVMNHQWRYVGSLNKAGNTLTLRATGPLMTGEEGTAQYRDQYKFLPDGRMNVTSQMQTPDGKWVTFMSGVSKKVDGTDSASAKE